jgi:hypothetical protein
MSRGPRIVPVGLALLATGILAFSTKAQDRDLAPRSIADQSEEQKRIQAETDQTARRISTMLRVLAYHDMGKGEEQTLLKEAATTLGKLSKQQMTQVLAHLENAAKANDPNKSGTEVTAAYKKHREIVENLKTLLAKYDTIKTLDQAADRLERLSREEYELYLNSVALSHEIRENRRYRQTGIDDFQDNADRQKDIGSDLDGILDQLARLKNLTPEQKDRYIRSEATSKGKKIVSILNDAQQSLRSQQPELSATKQTIASNGMMELAHALRTPREKLEVLKQARAQLDKAIEKQEEVQKETKTPPPERPNLRARPSQGIDPKQQHARELAKKENRVEYDAKETRDLLKSIDKELADKLNTPVDSLKEAAEQLRDTTTNFDPALEKEEKALEKLQEARQAVEEQIAKEEKAKTDPLEAVKKAQEEIEKLIKDQTSTKEKTEQTKGTQTEKMPNLSKEEKALAKRTDAVKNAPLPEKDKIEESLSKAKQAMDKATKALDDKKGMEAVKNQDEALKKLEEAKKALEDKRAEIEKRREEIAKLEEAAEKLEKLAKQQQKLGDEARENEKQGTDDTKPLVKEQSEIKPEAEKIGEEVEKLAPKASEKINESGEKMENTKKNLEKKELDPAAKNSDKAAEKLREAKDELTKAADELKAQEIAEQAKLQPNQVQPMTAQQQLEKALEETMKAQEQSKQANKQNQADPMKPDQQAKDLAKLQEQVGDKAKDFEQPEASKDAQKAADAIKEGDLPKAIEAQKDALKQLQKADPMKGDPMKGQPMKGDPMKGDPMMGMSEPMPSEAKNNGDLAKAQQQILDATMSLQEAQQANNSAQAALTQAQATAPMAVQPQLNQAQQSLQKAQQNLQKADPMQAQQAQGEAQQALQQALDTLNAAQQAMGMGEPMPGQGQPMPGQGQPMPGQGQPMPGQGKGEPMPGMGEPMDQPGEQKGPSQENPRNKGKGDREPDGKLNNAASKLQNVKGEGAFINLPPRQREMIQQALSDKLPPEFSALIRQYYMNIAGGKAATPTGSGDKK